MSDPLLSAVAASLGSVPVSAGCSLGVAVSGGADSMVLLHALHHLASEFSYRLTVLHVNHKLRGVESQADQEFVSQSAAALGVASRIFPAPIDPGAANLEEAARDERRRIWRELRPEFPWIATGHTRSDQAETVLFRLLRGTGLSGLAGIRAVSEEGFLRPLLAFDRAAIRRWGTDHKIRWREDESNSDSRFRRNLLRNRIFPILREEVNPAVEAVLARTAELAQDEERYWSGLVAGHLPGFVQQSRFGLLCDLSYLRCQHLAVQRRLLRHLVGSVRGGLQGIDLAHVDAVLALGRSFEGHDRVIIPGVDALRSFGTLRLTRSRSDSSERGEYRLRLVAGNALRLPFDAGTVALSTAKRSGTSGICAKVESEKERNETVTLDVHALGGPDALQHLMVRNWQPGDRYQPAGHHSSRKIKEFFQENRILLWERRHWPVVELNGEIIWAKTFGAAHQFQAEQEPVAAVSLFYSSAGESNAGNLTSEEVVSDVSGDHPRAARIELPDGER